ncbi:MAG: hypothetical protein WCB68_16515 [Pyrinomonadaceae bacterium]
MRHFTQIIRYTITASLLCGAFAIAGAQATVKAQDKKDESAKQEETKKTDEKRDPFAKGRDPFVKYRPPVVRRAVKKVPEPVAPPSIQDRIDRYKAQKLAAMTAHLPAPKPTTALLLSELSVTGIFRTPRGYAAMVEASPIKLSYVVYPGETFFDGQLVAIEENRLVFRHESRWTDGRLVKNVETRPLRQPDPIVNSMAATKASAAAEKAPMGDNAANAEAKKATQQ